MTLLALSLGPHNLGGESLHMVMATQGFMLHCINNHQATCIWACSHRGKTSNILTQWVGGYQKDWDIKQTVDSYIGKIVSLHWDGPLEFG